MHIQLEDPLVDAGHVKAVPELLVEPGDKLLWRNCLDPLENLTFEKRGELVQYRAGDGIQIEVGLVSRALLRGVAPETPTGRDGSNSRDRDRDRLCFGIRQILAEAQDGVSVNNPNHVVVVSRRPFRAPSINFRRPTS